MRALIRTLALLSLICLATALAPGLAMAQPPADPSELVGEWTYSRDANGYVYVDQLTLVQGQDGPTGSTTFLDGGKEEHEIFRAFDLSDGEVFFVTERPDGNIARHEGQFSEDGLSIRGTYNLGMGVGGSFVLARAGQGCPPLANARWHFAFKDAEGNTVARADGGLLGDTTGFVKGYIYFDDGSYSPKSAEGSLIPEGGFELAVYGSLSYTLSGALSQDGALITGEWTNNKGGMGTFSMDKQ